MADKYAKFQRKFKLQLESLALDTSFSPFIVFYLKPKNIPAKLAVAVPSAEL